VVSHVDVLIISALPVECEQARAAGSAPPPAGFGVAEWVEGDPGGSAPYLYGEGVRSDGGRVTVALARPARMGGRPTGAVAAVLAERLRPSYLVMCGVCAGNPAIVGLGDVVVAEIAYAYDEGQQTAGGLVADHRQIALDPGRLRTVQDFSPVDLPSHGPASEDEATIWLLEQLLGGRQPREHPARDRFFPAGTWAHRLTALEAADIVARRDADWVLTPHGRTVAQRTLYDNAEGPHRLPFAVVAGPMASGSAVVRDGMTWERISGMGVRTVAGLEMEAATVATVAQHQRIANWLVVKGVSDHGDPAKDDRYRRFAARASAEVLYALLNRTLPDPVRTVRRAPRRAVAVLLGVLLVGLVTGGAFLGANLAAKDRNAPIAAAASPGTPGTPHSVDPTTSAPGAAGPAGGTPSMPVTDRAASRFFGGIRFDDRWFGQTLSTGQAIDGTVTGWSAGFQIWLFARPANTDVLIAQGPCTVDGGRWTCANLKLDGPPGTREYLDIVVASDTEAATYAGRSTVPRASAGDSTQIYKG
jgi:nucleoside phosphorylase